jgi:hypothetical protein
MNLIASIDPGLLEFTPSAEEILAELRTSPYRELRRVACRLEGVRLILTGTVSSFYLKQLAQGLLFRRFGDGLPIINHLEVRFVDRKSQEDLSWTPAAKG